MSDITVQSDGTGITVAASGPQGIQGPAGSGSPDDQQQIIYVSKVGIDTASGLNLNAAKLTIGAAITAASAMTPSSSNQIAIQIIDSGNYVESFSLPEWVHINGVNADVDGTIDLDDNCIIRLRRLANSGTGECISKINGAGLSKVVADIMFVSAVGNEGIAVKNGQLGCTIGTVVVDGGSGFLVRAGSRLVFDIQYMNLLNSGRGFLTSTTGGTGNVINGNILLVDDDGTGRFIRTVVNGDIVDIQGGEFSVNSLYDLGLNSILNLFAHSTTGSRTADASAQINIVDTSGDSNLQGDLNVEGALTGPSITSITDAIDFLADGPTKVDTLADLSQYLNGSVYELPAGDYLFRKDINWGTATIDLNTTNGRYTIDGANFRQHTYTGTTPWITTTTTGVSLILSDIFVTTANATAISLSNGNSLIMRIAVFGGCKQCVALTNMAFLTGETVPMVGCEKGMVLEDVTTITLSFAQWNSGQNLSGIAVDCFGAASERFTVIQSDSRPAATESFYNFRANYGGDVDILGGIHTTGAGSFFTAGSRDQNDVDIEVNDVKNVTSSKSTVAIHIAPGDELSTTIVQDTQVIIAGTFTEDVAQRFTTTAAGRVTYIGKESMVFNFTSKFLSTPASGNGKNYDFYLRLNGTTLIDISYDTINVDAGNPQKAGLIGEVSLVTNDYLELIVIGRSPTPTNLTCEALALIVN